MVNEKDIPKMDIPVITIIKEISLINSLDIMQQIYGSLIEMGYNPVLILPEHLNDYNPFYINVIKIPACFFKNDMSIYAKIKTLRNVINNTVREKGYNIAITDSVCGVFQSEDEQYSEFLSMEIIEAFDPDYVIAHVLAEDYIMPQTLIHQFELHIRREIDAIIISNIFFDIVKYREDKTKRYLSFSENTIYRLTQKLSKQITIPVFSKTDSAQICKHIEEKLSSDIGNCKKVGNNDKLYSE